MNKMLRQLAIRSGSRAVRRGLRRRPGLTIFLIILAAVVMYLRPDLFESLLTRPVTRTPEIITGQVIRVSDGDTIVVSHNGTESKIRLYGLDAPEMMQARGRESKKYLARLVSGKTVKVEIKDVDRYKRLVARVFVETIEVDRQMVAAGQAWVYESYCKAAICRNLRQLQTEAKKKRLGLWRDKSPTPPWIWRKEKQAHDLD